MCFDIQDFKRLRSQDLLGAVETLPSLALRLENEIGACMRRANVHLDAFSAESETALGWLIAVCNKVFSHSDITIWLQDAKSGRFCVVAFRPAQSTRSGSSPPKLTELVSHVVRHKAALQVGPTTSENVAVMIAPMLLGRQLIGVVQVQKTDHEFEQDDLGTFSLLVEVFTLGCFLAVHDRGATAGAARMNFSHDAREAA